MSENTDLASRSDILALAMRIRELEAQLVRMPAVSRPQADGGTDNCTRCKTDNCTDCGTGKCTHCAGDEFQMVILPGELERLSGAQLVKRLQSGRTQK